MKIRDLELELEIICQQELYDVESVISRFGHGDCHDLTVALMDTHSFDAAIVILGESSQTIIHSCVLLDNETTLDAYGVNKIIKTLDRYGALAFPYLDVAEKAVIERVSRKWFADNGIDRNNI